jgi:hypothetical protein
LSFKHFVCVLLLITLIAVVAKPARAEAMDPQLIMIIAGVAITVVAVIAVVIIANASEGRRRSAEVSTAAGGPAVVVFRTTAVESP